MPETNYAYGTLLLKIAATVWGICYVAWRLGEWGAL